MKRVSEFAKPGIESRQMPDHSILMCNFSVRLNSPDTLLSYQNNTELRENKTIYDTPNILLGFCNSDAF